MGRHGKKHTNQNFESKVRMEEPKIPIPDKVHEKFIPAENPLIGLPGLDQELKKIEQEEKKNNIENIEKQLIELFPLIDKPIIKMILEEQNNDFEKSLESLFSINPEIPMENPLPEEQKIPSKVPELILTPGFEDFDTPNGEDDPEFLKNVYAALALSFVENDPRFSYEKILSLVQKYKGDFVEIQNELEREYESEEKSGKIDSEEKYKAEVMEYYLDGEKPSEEFKQFYFYCDLLERVKNKYKVNEKQEIKKEEFPRFNEPMKIEEEDKKLEKKIYDAAFPELPKTKALTFLGEKKRSPFNEVSERFPKLDKQIIRFVLNFLDTDPAIDYLCEFFPDLYYTGSKIAPRPAKIINNNPFKKNNNFVRNQGPIPGIFLI